MTYKKLIYLDFHYNLINLLNDLNNKNQVNTNQLYLYFVLIHQLKHYQLKFDFQ